MNSSHTVSTSVLAAVRCEGRGVKRGCRYTGKHSDLTEQGEDQRGVHRSHTATQLRAEPGNRNAALTEEPTGVCACVCVRVCADCVAVRIIVVK